MVETRKTAWGKISGAGYHPLAHHCADVAACFLALCRLPVVRHRLEQAAGRSLCAVTVARLAVLAFLHDVGKVIPGFQAKGWGAEAPRSLNHRGHVQEGLALFFEGQTPEHLANQLPLEDLESWGPSVGPLLSAALCHHGRPVHPEGISAKLWGAIAAPPYDPAQAVAELTRLLRLWFADAFAEGAAPLPTPPAFQHLFCGLVNLADWLGSDTRFFPYVEPLDEDYITQAHQRAAQAVQAVGLDTQALRDLLDQDPRRLTFAALTGHETPRPQQQAIAAIAVDQPLVILESETGSGKTESALWRFLHLFAAGRVDSLYFAVPTRAAALQLHRRVVAAMGRVFGPQAPPVVLAVPGYLKAGEAEGQALPDWSVRWDDDGNADENRLLARWAAENSKRSLAAPVAVGTVDQAMLAGLTVKHAHMRAAALSRSLIVLDEIHASDRYMAAVQTHLLTMHLGYGGHALLMSATLGSELRAAWQEVRKGKGRPTLPTLAESLAAPYPALWGEGAGGPLQAPPHDGAEKQVSMTALPTMDPTETARHAIEAAQAGARVLVIRNTVTSAVKTWEAVREAGAEPLLLQVANGPALHHGRFAAEDRVLLDQAVEAALSPKTRPPGGVIVIGTQTLEQSLDIDADVLLTDLCPVDVLLQRLGRLHRHRIKRPAGFDQPRCTVMVPEEGLAPLIKPGFNNGLGGWMEGGVLVGIYRDVLVLEGTRRLIAEKPLWIIPAMNRELVELALHRERLEALTAELGEDWQHYANNVYGKDVADSSNAFRVALPITDSFDMVDFPDTEEKIRTRLGAEGARLSLPESTIGPFGHPITTLTLPAHWSQGVDTREGVEVERGEEGLFFVLGNRQFRYSRIGLEKGSIRGPH